MHYSTSVAWTKRPTEFRESLVGNFALGDTLAVAACLAAWAGYALSNEDLEIAARLFGVFEAIQDAIHTPLMPWDDRQVQRNLTVLRQQLDPAELKSIGQWGV